ncbi:glycogen debranching enzyme GlgX [Thalassoporum mexicanum PCC 7367]|uniref:glycogen debranching protein GlgX n=1 Tax=Thalassoporum mexicanum TaxID=3457544 RepID=UPI00029FC5D3|nr:glycogen debranching protein GlgX [Pseudanabaena sp. PCC 7367]AFY71689.1 glycogen debranching enzyme GlgX [Pseudanabaena sp. PCC 7367]
MVLDRIDIHPTHEYKGFKLRYGRPFPFGATLVPGGVNFSIFSRHATACTLVLFERHAKEPFAEIPFLEEFRIGNVFTMTVFDLNYEELEYGYRMDGPYDPKEGHWFDKTKILMDPYARIIGGRDIWGKQPDWDDVYHHRARIAFDDFDWESDRPLEIPPEDLTVYEMHVRSFTKHESSGVKHPGTYAAIRDKIPYLKELGVNCIELMPIYEFDEFENSRPNPQNPEETLMNYWGYSTVGFFAPKAGYAATGKFGMQVDELKAMIKELHRNGIEVILDVVFNHTAEGNEKGPYISYRGLDNQTYYMLTPDGYYFNFSGTGNTLNCNNPIVRNMVLDCLRYWAAEYHVDGFRFDLASILSRDAWGAPLANPPLLETLAFDPILAKCKLIAEAWDAGGLYQVGSFPAFGRWAEWNGKYRDCIRKFIKGDDGMAGEMAQRIQGSPDLYAWGGRGPATSINFITCHDGFTLMDTVSYNGKHNDANGEDNRDGNNDNDSWNCGWEGPTDDSGINALRQRQIKNAVAIMIASQGVPMFLMGDEMGRTKYGNNNTYCHDNELNWLDWDLLNQNQGLFRFFKLAIAFRMAHPVLRSRTHFRNYDYVGSGYSDITWHGTQAWNADWSDSSHALAFMLCGKHAKEGTVNDDYIYVAMNTHWDALWFEPPGLPEGMQWHVFANTGASSPEDVWTPGQEPALENQHGILLGDRSVVILVGR